MLKDCLLYTSTIYEDLMQILTIHKPEAMSVEKLFFNSNQKTVIDVAQARGAIVLAATKMEVPVYEYTPVSYTHLDVYKRQAISW